MVSPPAGPLTLLAPSNVAFTQLPAGQLRRLLRDRRRLRQLLLGHVIPGPLYSAGLQPFQERETLAGSTVRVFSDTGNATRQNQQSFRTETAVLTNKRHEGKKLNRMS